MENILELHLRERCKGGKGSFICLEKKKKKMHQDLTIPVLIHRWYRVFLSPGARPCHKRLTAIPRGVCRVRWQFLYGVGRDTALPVDMTLVPVLPSSWTCKPAFNHSVCLLVSLCPQQGSWMMTLRRQQDSLPLTQTSSTLSEAASGNGKEHPQSFHWIFCVSLAKLPSPTDYFS